MNNTSCRPRVIHIGHCLALLSLGSLLAGAVFAQEAAPNAKPAAKVQVNDPNGKKLTEKKSAAAIAQQKLVDSATINLRTTVTGNQEQPRVLYILPWQSPATPELSLQMLSSQQEAVFGHVEREELMRSLEAAGELDETAPDKSPAQ